MLGSGPVSSFGYVVRLKISRNPLTLDLTGLVTVAQGLFLTCCIRLAYESNAGVAKLEYARDLGSRGRETVRVRVPPSALNNGRQ